MGTARLVFFWNPEEQLLTKPTKNPKSNKNEHHDLEIGDLLNSDIREWLQEFRENLVDDRVLEHRDSHPSSSHELSLEPKPARSEILGKHSVISHFPEDRNCDICLRTKIKMASCRKRTGTVVPRAEQVGDLMTADHKVLSEESESRHNHRKKVRLKYCCSQVWMKNGRQIPWNAIPIFETFKISCLMGRLHTKDVLAKLLKHPIIPFGSLVEYFPITAKDQSRIRQFGKKVLPGLFFGYALYAG